MDKNDCMNYLISILYRSHLDFSLNLVFGQKGYSQDNFNANIHNQLKTSQKQPCT